MFISTKRLYQCNITIFAFKGFARNKPCISMCVDDARVLNYIILIYTCNKRIQAHGQNPKAFNIIRISEGGGVDSDSHTIIPIFTVQTCTSFVSDWKVASRHILARANRLHQVVIECTEKKKKTEFIWNDDETCTSTNNTTLSLVQWFFAIVNPISIFFLIYSFISSKLSVSIFFFFLSFDYTVHKYTFSFLSKVNNHTYNVYDCKWTVVFFQ